MGINLVLSLVKTQGALIAVTVTTVRKAITIVLSFLLFRKPFSMNYLWGGSIIFFATYLNLYNKNREKCKFFLYRCIGRIKYRKSRINKFYRSI